jgi:hypothetical protein
VVCIHDGFRFVLNVPHLGSPTSEVFTVHPCSLGYAPIAPSDNCETWIHMDTIMRFKSMHLNGLSATSEPCRLGLISGCCHALTLSNRCVQSSRTPSRSRSGSTPCGRVEGGGTRQRAEERGPGDRHAGVCQGAGPRAPLPPDGRRPFGHVPDLRAAQLHQPARW